MKGALDKWPTPSELFDPIKAIARQSRAQPFLLGVEAGEHGSSRGWLSRPGLTLRQEGNAAGDAVSAMDEPQRMGSGGGQFGLHQRKMGTGEDDHVHALPPRLSRKACKRRTSDPGIEWFPAQLGFGQLHQGC